MRSTIIQRNGSDNFGKRNKTSGMYSTPNIVDTGKGKDIYCL